MGTVKIIDSYNSHTNTKEVWKHITRVNKETGDIVETEETETIEYAQERFMKINTKVLLDLMVLLTGNSRLVLSFILHNASRGSNIALIKQADAAEALGLSKATVERCFVELQKFDVIRKKEAGQWMVNPELATGCLRQYKNSLIYKYKKLRPYEPNKNIEQIGDEDNDS